MNTIQTLTGPSTTATGSSDRIIDGADDVGPDVGDLTTDAMTVAPPRGWGDRTFTRQTKHRARRLGAVATLEPTWPRASSRLRSPCW